MIADRQGDITTNGLRLHYYRSGGGARPLVLAHGLTDHGLCWAPIAAQLAADYDIVMYDARGHGRSDQPATGYTYDQLAADLAGLIQALKLTAGGDRAFDGRGHRRTGSGALPWPDARSCA